jgi:type IV fimbrial biogenesis protein FimT
MRPPSPLARGLTLLELVVAIAITAVLVSLALPSLGARLDRQRVVSAAESLAADVNEARFEAARQGRPVHLLVQGGSDWCWAVARLAACPCGQAQACELRASTPRLQPGIGSVQGASLVMTPQGRPQTPGAITLQSQRGLRLRVEVQTLGRARVCSEGATLPGYPAC